MIVPSHPFVLVAGSVLAGAVLAVACATTDRPVPPPLDDLGGTAYEAAARVELPKVAPAEEPGLHNLYRLSEHIVSGSEPHGEEAFRRLQAMGIRTILSVDGKVPDQALAAKYDMRYVHVPIQYRGITAEEMTQIAKTFREKPGPFYVHCFHGKHRGPAAAAVGRLVVDGVPRERALAEMRQWCGTAASYEGLYRVIAAGRIPDEARTAAYAWDFPAAHTYAGFRQAMIEVSRTDDNLKYLSKRGWKPDAGHPDADAMNDATKLVSMFEQTKALDDVAGRPADFRRWLDESVAASAALRDAVRAWKAGDEQAGALDKAYQGVADLCSACHKVYRN